MTRIEWTSATWNPVRGCRKVSAGCSRCYAEKMAARFSGPGQPYEGLTAGGKWTGLARFVSEMLDKPLRWRKPRRVFVNSMSDLFHEDVTSEQIAAVFGVMAACPQHTFQILTKRPERMRKWFEWAAQIPFALSQKRPAATCGEMARVYGADIVTPLGGWHWPLSNVWLGVSCEDQRAANERIPLLLQTPAAVRWVSCEPLLGPIDLIDAQADELLNSDGECRGLDWIVVGSESGRNARPMQLDWVRQIRDDCVEAGVPMFYKHRIGKDGRKVSMPELDGVVWDQYPEAAHG